MGCSSMVETGGGQHDPEQDDDERVAEGPESDRLLPLGSDTLQRVLGRLVLVRAEVGPEEQRRQSETDRREHDLGDPDGGLTAAHADADGEHRLAEDDEQHQPVAFDEVGRPQREGRPGVETGQESSRGHLRQYGLGHQGNHPEDDEGASAKDGAHEDEDGGNAVPDTQLHDHAGSDPLGLREVHRGIETPATIR